MENDIEIDELARINQQKEQKLKKMKSNIQKLQVNMSKKFASNKSKLHNQPKQPTTIYQHYQKEYTSTSPVNSDKQFVFNSTLFKNINNQSQPVLDNGSAVSNFSSVSNINNLLNGKLHPEKQISVPVMQSKYFQKPKMQNNLLSDIDRLLQKSKNAKKMPVKAFQKYIDIKQVKQSKSFTQIQELPFSSYSNKKNQLFSTKTKLQQYQNIIQHLDPIPQNEHQISETKYAFRQPKVERYHLSNLSDQSAISKNMQFGHKKSDLSNLSNKSQFNDSKIHYPPLPSNRTIPQNTVQRHKALIKQSFQEKKKLQTEVISQNLDKTQIDLELSDQENEQQRKAQKHNTISNLLSQREQLLKQLELIQKQLQTLQASI